VVNGEFRIGADERAHYLRRVPRAIGWSDWILMAYAIMSNHVHWAKFAALEPLSTFFASLHSGFAHSVNNADGRSGPFFAGRPADWIVKPEAIASTIAYIHNNPVRASVVKSPEESDWTSHRAFIGLAPAPPWLDVEFALRLCGYDVTPAGRLAFHEFVLSERDTPRDERLADSQLRASQSSMREALGTPVQLGSAVIDSTELVEFPVLVPLGAALRPRWPGPIADIVRAVSGELGIPVDTIRSGDRTRAVAHARRMVVHLGRAELGMPLTEIAAAVGLSAASACNLVRRFSGDRDHLEQVAQDLAQRLWVRVAT
jgi:hypothetical protein